MILRKVFVAWLLQLSDTRRFVADLGAADVDALSFLQHSVKSCTEEGHDPWESGSEVPCCAGLQSELVSGSGGNWHYVCKGSAAACTEEGHDPWESGSEVPCCAGLHSELVNAGDGGNWHYVCQSSAAGCAAAGEAPQGTGCCDGLQSCQFGSSKVCLDTCKVKQEATCLCMFDIDRTLTAKQGSSAQCPGTRELTVWDWAYGGGNAVLSALSNSGIKNTFCGSCYLGLCSAGQGSGIGSPWNDYLLDEVVRSDPLDDLTSKFPFVKTWSTGTYVKTPLSVKSPFVIAQPDKQKQFAVELVRKWYEDTFGFTIQKQSVYFFDDRTENIPPFAEEDIPAKQISCQSRDQSMGGGIIGLCGALPEQVVRQEGQLLCPQYA